MLYKASKYGSYLKGTAASDQFIGYEGDDTFVGMGGQDSFEGGAGFNRVDYSWVGSAVTVNLNVTGFQATGGGGSNKLVNIQGLAGGAYNDRFTGNGADNKLYGNGGNDWLSGNGGSDQLYGGDGNDQLFGGDGNDRLEGGEGDDQLTGSAGDDRLEGYWGADILDGGAGNDYILAGGGANRIIGGEGNDHQVGGGDNDIFVGGAGADTHYGQGGDDIVTYAASTAAVLVDLSSNTGGLSNAGDALGDTYSYIDQFILTAYNDTFVDSLGHIVRGGAGNDTMYSGSIGVSFYGEAGLDTLNGSLNSDYLNGGDGNDVIVGGVGADVLYGGAGSDRFVLRKLGESTVGYSDRIYDFGKGDLLDLQAIDANTKLANDQAFKQVAAFTKSAGQLVLSYDPNFKLSTVLLDVDGDAKADARILIDGRPEANGAWLVL